jgi:Mg-chelatase subunit ChlD
MEDPTEIIMVIDISGSMLSIKDDAIGGFNSFLEEQKKLPGSAKLTMIKFSHEIEIPYNGADLATVRPLNDNTYIPGGLTALYDAIGTGITEALKRGKDRKVVVAILTDGLENSSKLFNQAQVKSMIDDCEKAGWAFIFLATGFSQFEAEDMSRSIGIKGCHTSAGSRQQYGSACTYASNAVRSYRSSGSVDDSWNQ